MKKVAIGMSFLAPLSLVSCRTLNFDAEKVAVVSEMPERCDPLGTVYADWAWWGAPTEILNVMRNQTARLGGNQVWLQQPNLGFAYKCSADSLGTVHTASP